MEQCVVVISQMELDKSKHMKSVELLLEGLESMKPEVIVLMGDYIS